ncbi:MAG: ATP-binding protein [Pseudomonadota bacterium]
MNMARKSRRISLVTKFNLLVTLIIVLTMLGTAALLLHRQKTTYRDELLNSGAVLADQLAAGSEYALYTQSEEELGRLIDGLQASAHVAYVRYLDAAQKGVLERRLTGTDPLPPFTLYAQTHFVGDVRYAEVAAGAQGETYFDLVAPVLNRPSSDFAGMESADAPAAPLGYVQIGISQRGLHQQVRVFMRNAAVAATVFVLLGLGAVFLVTRRIAQPLKRLAEMSRAAAEGDYDHTIEVRTHDEVRDLAESFNRMLRNLRESRAELVRHQENLEHQVRERTQDLAEAKERALALAQQAEASSHAKSLFLANMSHELRTPLTAIIGFAGTLLDRKSTMEERIEGIRSIIRNGQHLQQIINDILDLSKIEADKLNIEQINVDYFQLLAELESVVGMQARNKGLAFDISYQFPLPPTIQTDPLRLKQILINLCSNAIKFTDTGGVHLAVICNCIEQQLQITVSDTGIGLSDEQRSRLFQDFEQADKTTTRCYGGTGLGLSLSRKLARLMGGDIRVESKVGMGSRFIVSVATGALDKSGYVHQRPAVKAAEDQDGAQQGVNGEARLQGHVLLAEDTPDNQRLISLYITKLGARVSVVGNGRDAVETALAGDFDVVLMDMQMPVMDGVEAVMQLRRMGYRKPIAALTANAMREDQARCLQAGCDDFLTKPISREALVKFLQMHLQCEVALRSDLTPLRSTLLETDPTFADLVQGFIDRLPQMQQQVRSALQSRDAAELKKILHDLKGVGGSYGYEPLFEMMKQGEFLLAKQDFAALDSLIRECDQLCARIIAGRPA